MQGWEKATGYGGFIIVPPVINIQHINCYLYYGFVLCILPVSLLIFIIPHAMCCGGYNVFDPSVSQSGSKSVSTELPETFVVMKDIMCRCAYHRKFLFIFFLWITLFLNLNIWRKWKILLKQLVSANPLNPLNRIPWNFVVMKDIMCRYAFLQEMLIWSFRGAIYIPFFARLPVTNAWNCHSLYTTFSSNVGAWGMWACSLFLSFCERNLWIYQYESFWQGVKCLILRWPLSSYGAFSDFLRHGINIMIEFF